ncbi:MAG: extracellular solute-binding protein [Ruminococcus sp.]|uniref:Extracellular solute-binding protein n=1 Tax=Schaedlerella arabinosiphila TaxID=2044587 RepID=A0A426DN04_9FIRM|nr:extracellular solute-binding protein [Schaedlerella arabinosiphila]MCI8723924.1 extracellular solute-binding protein [Ruminococcus sp.]RRK34126.1 extracellular solute-binding protein [Schaedlerella arabinosiphila]
MKRKISGLLVFFIAAFICSCSLKGSTGAGKDGAAGEQGQEGGAAEDGVSGEEAWNRTELQNLDGAAWSGALKYLADGTLRLSVMDQEYENAQVLDSRDNGESWQAADADMSLTTGQEYEYTGKYYSAEGIQYAYSETKLILQGGKGTETKEIHAEKGERFYNAAVSANTLAVTVFNDEYQQLRAEFYDLTEMERRQPDNPELLEYMKTAADFAGGEIALDSSGTVLYIYGDGIGRYDLVEDKFSLLIERDLYDKLMNPNEKNGLIHDVGLLTSFAVNDSEDKIVMTVWDSISQKPRLYRFDRGIRKQEKQASKDKLRIYSLKPSSIRYAATFFQEKYPELEVIYETGCTGEDSVTLTDAVRTLNTELMAGEGPDILILDGLPGDSYREKGILEDVTEIVEPEKEKYFYNVISACNEGNTIYQIPTYFNVPVILGDADVLEAKNRDELMEILRTKSGVGIPFLSSENLAEAAVQLFAVSGILEETADEEKLSDYYRDLETIAGLCFSDGEREIFSAYDKMTYWAKQYPDALFDPELDIYFDKAQAGIGRIRDLGNYMKTLSVCKEKNLSYQYLNREKGNHFIARDVIGINRGGKNPDAARQFLQYCLSGEVQKKQELPDISIVRDVLGGERYVSENGEYAGRVSRKYTPDEIMDLYKLTPAELEELITFFEGLDTRVKDDAVVMQKVMEQADACVFDGKDPKSAAADVCREVNLYLNE